MFDPANLFVDMAAGFGNYEHETEGDNGTASGDTDGGYLRLRGEYVTHIRNFGVGGGFSLEGSASDDELLEDSGSTDAEGGMSDLFMFVVGVPVETDRFRLPVRLGPYLHRMMLEEDSSDTEIDWDSIGVRCEVEPEFWFLRRDNFALGIVGDFSAGLHATSIDVEVGGIDDDFDGDGLTFGAGGGVQALLGDHVTTKVGFVYRSTFEDESDDSGGVVVREADANFAGFVFQLGVRF